MRVDEAGKSVHMSKLFVIRNQEQHYLSRDNCWVDGSEPQRLFRSPHQDAALNELFEATLHDPALRGEVLACGADAQGLPEVEVLNPIIAPAPALAPDDAESEPRQDPEQAETGVAEVG